MLQLISRPTLASTTTLCQDRIPGQQQNRRNRVRCLQQGLPAVPSAHRWRRGAEAVRVQASTLVRLLDSSSVVAQFMATQDVTSLPHAFSEHVPVEVTSAQVTVGVRSLPIVKPTDPWAVEQMHELLRDGDRGGVVCSMLSKLGLAGSRPLLSSQGDGVWAELWPSAVAMAEVLLAKPELVQGKRVCDVGCGLGLGGLAAAAAGCASVALYDREPKALWCGLASAAAAGFAVAPLPADIARSLPRDPSQARRGQPLVSADVLDWTKPLPQHLKGTFDLVLLCDVLYQQEQVVCVAAVASHLLADGGQVFLTDTVFRKGKEGLRALFMDAMTKGRAVEPSVDGPRRAAVRVLSREVVTVRMPAPELDSNTGDEHPVEFAVLR